MAAEVKVAAVRVAAGEERERTQQEAQDEADEIEDFPRHFCFTEFRAVRRFRLLCLVFRSLAAGVCSPPLRLLRGAKNFEQPFHQHRRFQHRLEQQQAAARVLVQRDCSESAAKFRILAKAV